MSEPNDDIEDILKSIQEKAAKSRIVQKKQEQHNKKLDDMNATVERIYEKAKLVPSDEIDIQKAQQDFTNYIALLFLQKYVSMEHEETGKPLNDIMDEIFIGFRRSINAQLLHNQEHNESKDSDILDSNVVDLMAIERKRIKDRRMKAIDEFIQIVRKRYSFKEDDDVATS